MVPHWTDGYVAEVAYPHTYVAELNPRRMQLPFLRAGLAVPEVATACELGFGQGLSVNIHAAASGVQWHGNDFIPDQTLNARELAAAYTATTSLTDESFAEYGTRDDLPDFDYIGLHGVWSWISDENRAHIVDFIRRKLKVGGVVYLGYNTQPGWAATIPLRELMTQHVRRMSTPAHGLGAQIRATLVFMQELLATNPEFARQNPSIAPMIASLNGQDTHYLAHEFFNHSWRPMSFAEMADALAPAKLGYACSAHHGIDALDLSPAQETLLRGIADPVFRESVRDFCVNQQFRKEYWVKGARKLNPVAQDHALRDLQVLLLTPKEGVPADVTTAQGEVRLDQRVFEPLLSALGDHAPQSLATLEEALAPTGVRFPQIVEAVALLEAHGHVAAAQSGAQAAAAKPQTDLLNMHLLNKALGSGDVAHFACPLTGGAIALDRVEQLFLCAWLNPPCEAPDLAPRVWQLLEAQGKKLLRAGQPLTSAQDNLKELDRLAQTFVQNRLPLLRKLGVYPGALSCVEAGNSPLTSGA